MPKSARNELIDLQKRWAKELKRRIYNAQGRNRPDLDQYYDEYRALFQKGFERNATRAELVRQLGLSQVAYFGDYHTLKTSQKTVAILLEQVITEHGRKVLLGLEMLHTAHQEHADAYLAGSITEDQFLKAINYSYTWGFNWTNFRLLFDLARKHGLKVIGLNSHATSRKGTLVMRDKNAAALVSAATMMHPGHLVAVLFGDLHVGETHLPARVRELLGARGIERRDLIVYQNSETFYWELVRQGKEQVVDAVRVKKGVYCIMNATPLVKFQSWLNWQEQGGELEFTGIDSLGHEYRGQTDLTQQFQEIIRTLAGFLKIPEDGLDNFTLFTTGDLDFLDELVERKTYSRAEIEDLKAVIARQHSAFFPRANIVYLGSLSINDAAEMAAKLIHAVCSGEAQSRKKTSRLSPQDAFYRSVIEEALGAFGVMVLNPRFRILTLRDHRARLASFKSRRRLPPDEAEAKAVSALFVKHADFIQRAVETGSLANAPKSLYELSASRYQAVTRAGGWELGYRLFQAVQAGEMPVEKVKKLFYERWEDSQALAHYVELRRSFKQVPEKLRPINETL